MRKYLILLASLLIQSILGGVYAWSTLAKPLRDVYQFTTFQTELIYGLSIGLFAISMIFTGKFIHRVGPRFLALLSSLLYFSAFFLAGQSGGNFLAVFIGLGVLSGFAIGSGYVTPLTTAVRWFPKHKGLVTGIAVFGFGGGSILNASLVQYLLGQGWDILNIFTLLSFLGSIIIFFSGLVMSFPPVDQEHPAPKSYPASTVFQNTKFWILAFGMFSGTLGGLIVIGKVANMISNLGLPELGAVAVAVVAVGNSLGRLFWGWLEDKWPRWVVPASLLVIILSQLTLAFLMANPVIFFISIFLLGFGFGGSLVLYAVKTEKHFGTGSISSIYPLIFLGYGIAAVVGPPLGGWIYDLTQTYTYVLFLGTAISLAGFVVVSLDRQK